MQNTEHGLRANHFHAPLCVRDACDERGASWRPANSTAPTSCLKQLFCSHIICAYFLCPILCMRELRAIIPCLPARYPCWISVWTRVLRSQCRENAQHAPNHRLSALFATLTRLLSGLGVKAARVTCLLDTSLDQADALVCNTLATPTDTS